MLTPSDSDVHQAIFHDQQIYEAELVITIRGNEAFIVKDREEAMPQGAVSLQTALERIQRHEREVRHGGG